MTEEVTPPESTISVAGGAPVIGHEAVDLPLFPALSPMSEGNVQHHRAVHALSPAPD